MICAADLHLRSSKPQSRIDDYQATQEKKFRFILKEAQKSPPLVVAGDFFDRPRPGEGLLKWTIDMLRDHKVKPVVIPGQHDMPYHSLDSLQSSGLGVLYAAGYIELLTNTFLDIGGPKEFAIVHGVPFGQEIPKVDWSGTTCSKVLLWHHMVIVNPLWLGQEADKAHLILKKYQDYTLIVTGDNHQSFAIAETARPGSTPSRWIVNPGSMMRMTSAQADHKPCVYKWEGNKIEQIFIPIANVEAVLDLSTIIQEKERDARIGAFVERLQTGYEVALSFEKNLEEHLRVNLIDPMVQEYIWEAVG